MEGLLEGVAADVVLLGVGGLDRLGRDYAGRYWNETVARTGARRVFPIHWDDFSLPYGDVRAFPRVLGDLDASLGWLGERAREREPGVRLELLPFRRPVALY